MKTTTTQILLLLKIFTWIIFIGLCIKTGALAISFFVSLFFNPEAAKNLYLAYNLHDLHAYSLYHYISFSAFLIIISALKATLFYLVLKIFTKINLVHPFSSDVASSIKKMSYIALEIGILGIIFNGYAQWLMHRSIEVNHQDSNTEFLFMAGILFVIAQIFKRGIELQSENELTV